VENILITGVSTGIGFSLCKIFLENGCRVFGSVRNSNDATRLSADFGDRFHPLVFDVTNHKGVETSVAELQKELSGEGLACLINNAGIAVGGPVMFTSLEDYQRQFDVNVFGAIAVTKACLPLLGASKNYQNKPGKILNMSSVSGQIAFPMLSPYCASKFALEAFGDSLRRELLLYGIDVISIQPGPIKTPIWNKSAEIPQEVMASDYGPVLQQFQKMMGKSAKEGMEPDELARKIWRVYKKEKSKARYVFMNKKFINFTIPKYFISARRFDGFVKKMLFSK
jgi:NAD(P)-dependent dehydrogenase (short-subunit alcohol dehydrogenase family)